MSSESPSPEFAAAFLERTGRDGVMDFSTFVDLALYHPAVGYYRRRAKRVGREPGTDFVTASSVGPEFLELVFESAGSLLGEKRGARDFGFVEIGAELPDERVPSPACPFGSIRTVRLGEPLELRGLSIVFSNELFDAQPFRRLVYRGGAWRELGVRLLDGRLVEVELTKLPELDGPLAALADDRVWPEGYHLDAPVGAAVLAERLLLSDWTGLFLAFDYGKSWEELVEHTPAGTSRAYHRHRQSNDLLARPGEQDLTCHVCWDWLSEILVRRGFSKPTIESQEAFFVHRAGSRLASLVAAEAGRFSRRKSAVLELIHPAHFGRKFQVLHAYREAR